MIQVPFDGVDVRRACWDSKPSRETAHRRLTGSESTPRVDALQLPALPLGLSCSTFEQLDCRQCHRLCEQHAGTPGGLLSSKVATDAGTSAELGESGKPVRGVSSA